MVKHPWQNLIQTSRGACCYAYLRLQTGSEIELPIAVVREGRGGATSEMGAIGRRRGGGKGGVAGDGGERGGVVHAGEEVGGSGRGPAGGGVGDAAAPLEGEGQEGEGEREERQQEEELRGE